MTVHFFTLLTIKEIYLTCKNFLGLIYHPFKTIVVMRRDNDKIQTLLIFGLPFYLWLGGILGILMARYFLGVRLFPMGMMAKTGILGVSFLAGLIFSYLVYWFIFYLKRRKMTN